MTPANQILLQVREWKWPAPEPAKTRAAIAALGSSALFLLCPSLLKFPYLSFPWFTCLGVVLLAFSRFHRVRHGVPCPELLYLASAYVAAPYFSLILPSSRIPSLDETLWQFDRNFGYLEAPLAVFLLRHRLPNAIVRLSYLGLPLISVLFYLALPNVRAIRRKYCLASGLGTLVLALYAICPAAGPLYLNPRFPYVPFASAPPHPRILADVALNCAPSGHLTWALISLWFARRHCGRTAQAGAAAFLLLTCMGTLGLGEHYVADLIVAVPFAAAIWALTERQWRRAALDLAVVLAWLLALRHGWALGLPRIAVCLLSGATLAFRVPDHQLANGAPLLAGAAAPAARLDEYPGAGRFTAPAPNAAAPPTRSTQSARRYTAE